MTSSPLSSLTPARALLLGSLMLAAGCSSTTSTQPPAASAAPAAAPAAPAAAAKTESAPGAFDDDAHPLSAAETIVVSAGVDAAKLAAAQAELLAIIQKPDAAPADAQDAAQQLGLILLTGNHADHAALLNALAPLLTDPARSDYARLALDRAPGAGVDTLYLQALLDSTGRIRLGLIGATGTRHIEAAVPALARLLNDSDAATAAAAASALGRIASPAALEALAGAKDALTPAVLNARLSAAAKADAATAAKIAGDIYRNSAAPLPQRSAALRGLIAANPAGAIDEIHAALSGTEPAFRKVAIESVSTLPTPEAGRQLATRLTAYPAETQVAFIAALGHRSDASSIPGLLAALENSDASVRLAAIEALGRLPGTAAVAQKLARLATGKGDEAKAASAALARLNGPGLDDLIRQGAANEGDLALRATYIGQIAARNLTDSIPFLLSLRQSPEESLRLEALDALRFIASPMEQQPVIAWVVGAPTKPEQTRALRALITIALRDGDVDRRSQPVIQAITNGNAAARVALLPALSRLGGSAAITCASTLALDGSNEEVSLAATAELARWPDASPVGALVDLARGTRLESVRAAAVQGAARFLAQDKDASAERRSAQARTLLELPLAVPAKQALINVLSLCRDQAALDTAKKFLADPATAGVAQDAVDAITSNLAGFPVITASANPEQAQQMADGNAASFWQIQNNEPGIWIRADLHNSRPVRKVSLANRARNYGYPANFDVQVSDNPDQPGDAVAQGEGERGLSTVSLPAGTRGRYVWVRVVGKRDAPLAIAELTIE